MNAAELRLLSEALSWYVGQTFTPQHKETFAQAAEIIDLLAWAEESGVRVSRGDEFWWSKIDRFVFAEPTLVDTLRRAREAAR